METLNLTSDLVPRTYLSVFPPVMLDNIQFSLPVVVENEERFTKKYLLPSGLSNVCEGKNFYIGPLGNIVVGKTNLNTNGTKLVYGEIGKNYQIRSKNQNFLVESDIPLVKDFLSLTKDELLPVDLYSYQLKILFKHLSKIEQLLIDQSHRLCWKFDQSGRLNRIKRIELCQDFLAPMNAIELIGKLDAVISAVEGEPRRSAQERSKKYSRRVPFHYWDVKPSEVCFKRGDYLIKLYQKDRFVRIELACINVPLQNMQEGDEPFAWLQFQLLEIANAAASYLGSITNSLLLVESKINDFDRAELINGLPLYSSTLKYTDESVRIFVESLMDRQAYTPTAHRGLKIGRKSLENISEHEFGICTKISKGNATPITFVLRGDWKVQIEKKRKNRNLPQSNEPVPRPKANLNVSRISRREFILGVPVLNFFKKRL